MLQTMMPIDRVSRAHVAMPGLHPTSGLSYHSGYTTGWSTTSRHSSLRRVTLCILSRLLNVHGPDSSRPGLYLWPRGCGNGQVRTDTPVPQCTSDV
jgi:hypothetical protein